jgi:CheY-like chemotaxis protein
MDQNKLKVLLVDDESAIISVLMRKLEDGGFDVITANDGIEALAYLHRGEFDLLITDIIMPNLDGFSLIKRLREEKNPIPIIVATSLSQEEDRERALSLGANAYYKKADISPEKLINLAKNVTGNNTPDA